MGLGVVRVESLILGWVGLGRFSVGLVYTYGRLSC